MVPDRFIRFGWVTLFAFALWFSFAGQAFAAWEYTSKVAAESGGNPPGTGTLPANWRWKENCAPFKRSPWYESKAQAVGASIWLPLAEYRRDCGLPVYQVEVYDSGYLFSSAPYNYAASTQVSGPGGPYQAYIAFIGEEGCPNGGTLSGSPGAMECVGAPLPCPSGTTLVDGVCRPLVCPEGTPAWESDPQDSTQCRRPVQCPWPQRFDEATEECGCPSGRQVQFADGGGGIGLGFPIDATAAVQGTTMAPKPEELCLVEGTNTGGCAVRVDTATFNGTRTEFWGDVFTGATCTGSQLPAAQTAEESGALKCPDGQVSGTVNGVQVCAKAGETETKEKPTTKTETKTNADGTTTTTETTTECVNKCIGGECLRTCTTTTTITHKDSQGQTTGTESSTSTGTGPSGGGGGGGGGDGSSFGGTCAAFNCSGDAVQCAIALEQHKRNCEVLGNLGDLTREGAAEDFKKSREFDRKQLQTDGGAFGEGIAASSFLASGCVEDQSFTLWGEQIVLPFSSLCPYLNAAGLAFLAVCGLLSFRIVSKGVE